MLQRCRQSELNITTYLIKTLEVICQCQTVGLLGWKLYLYFHILSFVETLQCPPILQGFSEKLIPKQERTQLYFVSSPEWPWRHSVRWMINAAKRIICASIPGFFVERLRKHRSCSRDNKRVILYHAPTSQSSRGETKYRYNFDTGIAKYISETKSIPHCHPIICYLLTPHRSDAIFT